MMACASTQVVSVGFPVFLMICVAVVAFLCDRMRALWAHITQFNTTTSLIGPLSSVFPSQVSWLFPLLIDFLHYYNQ